MQVSKVIWDECRGTKSIVNSLHALVKVVKFFIEFYHKRRIRMGWSDTYREWTHEASDLAWNKWNTSKVPSGKIRRHPPWRLGT